MAAYISELGKKVERSVRFLKSIAIQDGEIELAYSGGKDSDVILRLAQLAGIDFRAIYKNTTIDPPGTISHCKNNGVDVRQPGRSFFSLVEQKGFPSRWVRFCCRELKEYKILDRAILGIRKSESKKRADRYTEPEICRSYGSKANSARQYLPILDWTDEDVMQFVRSENINLHPLYYRDDGTVDVTRRLGCVGCPLASRKNRVNEFRQYPLFLKQWIRHGDVFYKNRKHVDSNAFKSASEAMMATLFYGNSTEYRHAMSSTLFGEIDPKMMLENYFNIKL